MSHAERYLFDSLVAQLAVGNDGCLIWHMSDLACPLSRAVDTSFPASSSKGQKKGGSEQVSFDEGCGSDRLGDAQ
jgi:hypothetical protein